MAIPEIHIFSFIQWWVNSHFFFSKTFYDDVGNIYGIKVNGHELTQNIMSLLTNLKAKTSYSLFLTGSTTWQMVLHLLMICGKKKSQGIMITIALAYPYSQMTLWS